MSRLNLDLAESELKIILEGLTKLEQKMIKVCETSEDKDKAADYGNDLIEVRLLLKPLQKKAIEKFGEQILNFSRDFIS